MLRTDLIDVVNSGDAWAFIGSGISVDSGLPSWKGLLDGVLACALDPDAKKDTALQRYIAAARYPAAFGRLESLLGRDVVVREVSRLLSGGTLGRLGRLLADWPFAGYLTTNFDSLIQMALRERGELGWYPVGNSAEEARKVSGDARHLIWHVHGSVALPGDRSSLILSEKDYDRIYLDGSALLRQVRSVLSQRRVVFFGFGFSDPEVLRLLKAVGSMCSPGAPAFAFLSEAQGEDGGSRRLEFLEQYNVDIIPYQVRGSSHKHLEEILQVYEAFVLRRSLRFGQERRPLPSYDPETTGLLVYNRLALEGGPRLPDVAVAALLKARVLALLHRENGISASDLEDRLSEQARLATGREELDEAEVSKRLQECTAQLILEGHISEGADGRISLSSEGRKLIEEQAALAVRMAEQFRQSLEDRARLEGTEPETAQRIGAAADAFFRDLVSRRGLGVARAWLSDKKEVGEYHFTALLRTLPEHMVQLATEDEAGVLTRVVRNVLAKPTDLEKNYLGIALQAYFGVGLLGCSHETIRIRAREFEDTLFLVDSSTLIPALGRSSTGHEQARRLIQQLAEIKARVVTTPLLVEEVAEHARWALRNVGPDANSLNLKALAAATGRAGARSNVFLEGFLKELEDGAVSPSVGAYLEGICGDLRASRGIEEAFVRGVEALGVAVRQLRDWDGFSELVWAERDEVEAKIEARRRAKNTFTHGRQVKAEAEALLIIEKLRNGDLFAPGNVACRDAYFISNTGVIDRVADSRRPITMRPELATQWLSTVNPIDATELGVLTDGLLWELTERGFAIVDEGRIRNAFSPLIVASREALGEELIRHRELVSRRYGESAAMAFTGVRDVDAPLVRESAAVQRARVAEELLQQEKTRRAAAEDRAQLSEREKADAAAFKELKKAKRQKAAATRRAAASRPSGRRKRKRK